MRRGVVCSALVLAAGLFPATARAETEEVHVLSLGGGRLGVQLEEVDAEAARTLGLPEARGARVVDVTAGSAAEDAGIAEGDVIVGFDGEAVRSVAQLSRLVRETPPGREVEIEVVRDGGRRTLRAKLREGGLRRLIEDLELPQLQFDFEMPPAPDRPFFEWHGRLPDGKRMGIRYQEVAGQLGEYFGVDGRGVLVTHVEPGSAAGRAGIEAGDVLLELGGREIRDGGDLRRALREADAGTPLRLRVLRRGEARELELTLAEPSPRPRRGETL